MWNDAKIQEIFEKIKLKEIEVSVETDNVAIDETLEGYFYGVVGGKGTAMMFVMYTNKRLIFVQLTPLGELGEIIVTKPTDITDIRIKQGWMFYYVTLRFEEGEFTLQANKKVFGLKKQNEFLSKFSEQLNRYYVSK